jgi:hypothetical protein
MLRPIKFAVVASILSLLAACGGGGGGVANADPQGLWNGLTRAGYTVDALVLDTGETWGIYSSGSTVYGALYGTATTGGNTVTIKGTDFNFSKNTSTQGAYTGPITPKSLMTLSNTDETISLTYGKSYDTAATSAGPTGTWSYVGRSGGYTLSPGNVTIDSLGNFTLNQTNCTTNGSIVPRPGGKNVYNVKLESTGSGCATGQNTLTGVTYLDTAVTPNRFLALALTPSRNDGLIILGTRQN